MSVTTGIKRALFGRREISDAEARVMVLCSEWEAQMEWERNSGREVTDGEIATTVDDIRDLPADALLRTREGDLYQVFRPNPNVRLFCKLWPQTELGVDVEDMPLPSVLMAPFGTKRS